MRDIKLDTDADYQQFVVDYWTTRREELTPDKYEKLRSKFIMTTGLAGECGEVIELLKKEVRDGVLDRDNLALELGDVIYYLTRIIAEHGFTIREIQERNVAKLLDRRG